MAGNPEPKSITEFRRLTGQIRSTHVGPLLGAIRLGLELYGDGGVPFEQDLQVPPHLIPQGTKSIEVISDVSVLNFLGQDDKPIDVPLTALQTWAWCDRNTTGEWYTRT